MKTNNNASVFDRQQVNREIVQLLEDMTSDWGTGLDDDGIRPESRLIADLGFESIDVVALVAAIEEGFGRRDLPFVELLIRDGKYVKDIKVKDIVDFVCEHVVNRSPAHRIAG